MAVCLGPQLSKLAARISEPFVKCLQRLTYIFSWLGFANEDLCFFHVVVDCRPLEADQTDAGETGPRAVSAGNSNV